MRLPNRRRQFWLGRALKVSGTCSLLVICLAGCSTDRPVETATADPPYSSLTADSGAASSGEPAPVLPAMPKSQPPKSKRAEHKNHKTAPPTDIPPERLAAVEPSELIGKGPGGVAKLLGTPTSASQRDVSLIWTYASADCAFQVYFYPDIKTSLWHALQYASVDKNGGSLNPSHLCIQHILIARNNGTNW
jgi:hypothetical protein